MVLTRVLTVVAVVIALLAPAGTARADSSDEAALVAAINASRADAGLGPLSLDGRLVAYARTHTEAMIAAGDISHSSPAQLGTAATGWSLLGENVGMGPNPTLLHRAFMASPSHRKNILGPFDHVGVGATRAGDGTLFVTVIFLQSAAAPRPAAAAPAPAVVAVVAPAPKPAATPPPTLATPPKPSSVAGLRAAATASPPRFGTPVALGRHIERLTPRPN